MIRRLEGERPAFVLDTDATTYVISISPSGHVEHLYYGAKINVTDAAACDAFREKREFEPGNVIAYSHDFPTTVLEDMCLEMSSGGHGDIREPFLELVRENGSRTSDFRFASHTVTQSRTPLRTLPCSYSEDGKIDHLTLTLTDGDLVLELHYCVFPECDVITRSARLINKGAENVRVERLLSAQSRRRPTTTRWSIPLRSNEVFSEMNDIRTDKKISREFYLCDGLEAAEKLLGKILVHDSPEGLTAGRIVELEAYMGESDRGCHAYGGRRTSRTEIMYAEGGRAYVYLAAVCSLSSSSSGEADCVASAFCFCSRVDCAAPAGECCEETGDSASSPSGAVHAEDTSPREEMPVSPSAIPIARSFPARTDTIKKHRAHVLLKKRTAMLFCFAVSWKKNYHLILSDSRPEVLPRIRFLWS